MSKIERFWVLVIVVVMLTGVAGVSLALADPLEPGDDGESQEGGDDIVFCGVNGYHCNPAFGRGGRMGGRYGRGIRNGWMAGHQNEMHAAMAEVLGLSVEELEAAMADGQTMWEIAEAQGVDPATLWNAMQVAREDIIEQPGWMVGRTPPDFEEYDGFRPGPRRGMGRQEW